VKKNWQKLSQFCAWLMISHVASYFVKDLLNCTYDSEEFISIVCKIALFILINGESSQTVGGGSQKKFVNFFLVSLKLKF